LQEFFKERNKFTDSDYTKTQEINKILDVVYSHFKEKLKLVSNRAVAVSVFLFVSDLLDRGKESETEEFVNFFVKLIRTLKWQIPKGVHMDEAYHYLLDFQTYVTQAAGEKYAIQNRHDFLSKAFYYYKKSKAIEGDEAYFKDTGKQADEERELIKL
jgi:hypothetical protein